MRLAVVTALAVLLSAAEAVASQSGTVGAGPAQARALADAGLDVGETLVDGRLAIVVHGDGDRRALRAAGLTLVPTPRVSPRAAGALPSGRTSYRDLADYDDELRELADRHSFVRLVPIGASVQGRPLVGLEIAAGVGRPDDGRPVHVQLGLHHAREWGSGEVVMEYAHDLIAGYGKSKRITRLVDRTRTFLFPVMNPDGFVTSRTGFPLQRKNAAGVDLNRNYGAFWGGPGASDLPMSDTFRGPAPFSEPESRAFHDWSTTHQVMVVNSNHSYGGTVLYQPGFNRSDEPGLPAGSALPYRTAFEGLARRMAAAAGYQAQPAYALYDVTGATEDWNYFAQGALAYTTEIGSTDFQSPYADGVVNQYVGGLREAFLLAGEAALDRSSHAVLRGIAPPGATLTLSKDVALTTANVLTGADGPMAARGPAQALPEHLESTMVVPASGAFEWHVNPSTPPLVALAGQTAPWTVTCPETSKAVVVGLGETRRVDLQCGARTRLQVRRVGPRAVVVRALGTPVRSVRVRVGTRVVRQRLVRKQVRVVVPRRGTPRACGRAPDGHRVCDSGR